MSASPVSRLGSAAWLTLMLGVGALSGWWLELRDQQSAQQIIIGLYGDALIPIRCSSQGVISQLNVALGDQVNAQESLGALTIPEDEARLEEQLRASALAEAEVEAQLSALELALIDRGREAVQRQERMRAEVFAVEGELKRAEAQLKTLKQSLTSIEAGVKAGSITLAELTRLKSQASGLKRLIPPLTQQRGAWRQLMRLAPDERLNTLAESWRASLSRQRSIWRRSRETARARVAQRQHLQSPTEALVASQPLAPGSRCLAGETVLLLQPTAPVVRLWRLSGNTPLSPQEPLNVSLADDRYRSVTSTPHRVTIERVGSSLTSLPEPLQPTGRRVLQMSSLLTLLSNEPAPLVRGLPVRARLSAPAQTATPSIRSDIPWGAVIQVTQ